MLPPAMVVAFPAHSFDEDQRVVLGTMSWQDFEAFLAIRGERSGVRMYYLDGAIEIMSPTKTHEGRKKALARLLELWAMETGVSLNGFGSWTLKDEMREAGAEPDECYIVGDKDKDIPDLAIEVEWSRVTGLAKPEIYRRLGVRELWTIKVDGSVMVRVLHKGQWIEQTKSKLFPKLDLAWLVSFLDVTPQNKAVLAVRDALRKKKRRN
jgi:Uma2 family endonuclease